MPSSLKIFFQILFCSVLLLVDVTAYAQKQFAVQGTVRDGDEAQSGASVRLVPGDLQRHTDEHGFFRFGGLAPAGYLVIVSRPGYSDDSISVLIADKSRTLDINVHQEQKYALNEFVLTTQKNELVSGKLNDISGTNLYAGKKTEVIQVKNINANLATNNTRQIFARVPGLNIWEYDRGGLQLGIGGRGLSPNRSSNFNIRQNGYDISADALGYPESYYTPSSEAVDRIEVIRGAASLQYGPQFGGLVNYVLREGPGDKPFEFTTRQTAGSFGFFNSFNSIGGTVLKNKLNYYGFYQFKKGDDWRPNSHYEQHNAYAHLSYQLNPKLKLTGEYTYMHYLAQQPGGLTDAQFEEDASVSVRARNWFEVNWNLVNLNVDYKIDSRNHLNLRAYTLQGGREALGILSYINRPDPGGPRDLLSDRYSNFGAEMRYLHQYNLKEDLRSALLVGVRAYHGLTERQQGHGSDGDGPDFTFMGKEADASGYRFPGINVAAFAENMFQLTKHWTVTPGMRFEYINTLADGYYYKQNVFIASERIEEERSNPRSFVLLGVGTSWKFGNGTEIYGNISQNYRSINFNDIRVVNANARVDPALKDETGYNMDLGYRGRYKNWLYFDISAFVLRYDDRIGSVYTRDSDFMTYRLRTNVSDSRNLGVEMLLEADVLKLISKGRSKYKLNTYANLSLIDARYIASKTSAFAGKLVENVPPVLFRTGLSAGTQHFNLTWQLSYQADQYSDATNTEITATAVDGLIPAFSVMDLSLSYNWRWITLYGGVNNLTNEKYFSRRADGYPGPGILPADRRNFYLTLQVKI